MLTTTTRIRVAWSHCDPAQIIFNPHYYIWMDASTHALLKQAGLNLAEAIKDPLFRGFPLVTSSAQFHSPAVLDDEILLTSKVKKFGNTSFHVAHEFTRNNTLLCTGKEVRVWGGTDPESESKLIAIPVPGWVRENLSRSDVVDVSV
ncbi:hypothetical protein AB833_16195 [Chromatiales bacterium (ex Bugula neritina AB1)]|nr:hypothetical protein AB833_16195 [Chromatiales bacterium (ex Bugula neritina AB1)]